MFRAMTHTSLVLLGMAVATCLARIPGADAAPSEKPLGRSANGIWYVSSSDAITDHADAATPGSLAWVLSQVGTTMATVELAGSTTYRVGRDLSVPRSVCLRFQYGAELSVAPGATLTVAGGIQAGLQRVFSGEGLVTGPAQVGSVLPQWFGAAGDGVADDTEGLQKAVDFACRSQVLAVDLNRGRYRITRTLDCTNTRKPGSIPRDSLRLFGSSFRGTTIIGETGDGHAVIETSGSQWLELDSFMVRTGTDNRSTVGVFTGTPSVLPQSHNHKYHICIALHDDMAANGGRGTIGIWSFGSEEHTYTSMYINANRPVVLTAYNGTNLYEYTNSYVELLGVHSLGVTTFTGECFLVTFGKHAPAVTTIDVNSLHLQNTYIGNIGGDTGENTVAFDSYGVLQGFTYSGTIESLATLISVHGTLINANVNCTFGGVADPKAPVLALVAPGHIMNSDLKVTMALGADRGLFAPAPKGPGGETCRIANTTIKTTQTAAWATVPEGIEHDPANVFIFAQ